MPSKQSNNIHELSELRFHSEYDLRGGDLCFLVGSKGFRIHSYFFDRDSPKYRDILTSKNPPADSYTTRGDLRLYTSEDISEDQFVDFLWIFYNKHYDWTASTSKWINIYRVARALEFPSIRELAIRELKAKTDLEVSHRLHLYQEFGLDKDDIVPLFVELVMRKTSLTDDEISLMGYPVSIFLLRARENFSNATGGRKGQLSEELASQVLENIPSSEDIMLKGRA